MITKSSGKFTFICDECEGTEETFDTDGDFLEAVREAKENGWKVFKKHGEWNHKCPECVTEEE